MHTDVYHRYVQYYNGICTVCSRGDIIKPTRRCSLPWELNAFPWGSVFITLFHFHKQSWLKPSNFEHCGKDQHLKNFKKEKFELI